VLGEAGDALTDDAREPEPAGTAQRLRLVHDAVGGLLLGRERDHGDRVCLEPRRAEGEPARGPRRRAASDR
jgi:hypothetical protein